MISFKYFKYIVGKNLGNLGFIIIIFITDHPQNNLSFCLILTTYSCTYRYDTSIGCWESKPEKRPTFTQLVCTIEFVLININDVEDLDDHESETGDGASGGHEYDDKPIGDKSKDKARRTAPAMVPPLISTEHPSPTGGAISAVQPVTEPQVNQAINLATCPDPGKVVLPRYLHSDVAHVIPKMTERRGTSDVKESGQKESVDETEQPDIDHWVYFVPRAGPDADKGTNSKGNPQSKHD